MAQNLPQDWNSPASAAGIGGGCCLPSDSLDIVLRRAGLLKWCRPLETTYTWRMVTSGDESSALASIYGNSGGPSRFLRLLWDWLRPCCDCIVAQSLPPLGPASFTPHGFWFWERSPVEVLYPNLHLKPVLQGIWTDAYFR